MHRLGPYQLYSFSFLVVIVIYLFGWSNIYPKLTLAVLSFLILSIILSFLMGKFFNKHIYKNRILFENEFKFKKKYIFYTMIILCGNLLNGIYSHGFPLFGGFSYNNYGMPLINAGLGVFSSYFSSYIFLVLLLDKKYRKISFILFVVSLGTFVLALSRGMIVITLLNCVWEYLGVKQYKKTKNKNYNKKFMLVSVVLGMYIFGLLGNYRLNNEVGLTDNDIFNSNLILNVGDATQKFVTSFIPTPFYWTYLYASSPLANLQNIVDKRVENNMSRKYEAFIFTQTIPTIFGKRLFAEFYQNEFNSADKTSNIVSDYNQSNQYQISRNLNVGTTYYNAFYILGWSGVFFMNVFILGLPIAYFLIFNRFLGRYGIIAYSIFNSMYLLLIFDNFIVFTGLSLQLLFPVIQGVYSKIKFKNNKKNIL
ncbi:hypothetical protein [Liquorilactobacillus hordei]|uniref:Oligosaccharide repeat unit polymerase n=1 Tax=Liquorilactobacillus hordei TaxID=468911 RepID=A0A3S6QND7_9LACO|nr:hypothetical protein [Liquorilactobacillus hordei]AUJ29492.1 hypothetical protein BSQ49_04360 [Liquorilactobacillus hordei]